MNRMDRTCIKVTLNLVLWADWRAFIIKNFVFSLYLTIILNGRYPVILMINAWIIILAITISNNWTIFWCFFFAKYFILGNFYHFFGFNLFLFVFFELYFQVMYPIDIFLLFDFKLINSIKQFLLSITHFWYHLILNLLVFFIHPFNLGLVILFYLF